MTSAVARILLRYADRAHDNYSGRVMVPETILRDAVAIIEDRRSASLTPAAELLRAYLQTKRPTTSGVEAIVEKIIAEAVAARNAEIATLRDAVVEFLRRWDNPERYHRLPAVDDLRAIVAAPAAPECWCGGTGGTDHGIARQHEVGCVAALAESVDAP